MELIIAAILIFVILCVILPLIDNNKDSSTSDNSDGEMSESVKEILRKIEEEEKQPLRFHLYTRYNKVKKADYTDDEFHNLSATIYNTKLHRQKTIKAVDRERLVALAEEIFRLWARREEEPDYLCTIYNYVSVQPKQYRVIQFVGIKYRTETDYERYKRLIDGEKVLLVDEYTNPYDKNAVKVMTQDGFHIGYVAREYAEEVSLLYKHVGYAWHFHYDPKTDIYNALYIFEEYIEYDPIHDPFAAEDDK